MKAQVTKTKTVTSTEGTTLTVSIEDFNDKFGSIRVYVPNNAEFTPCAWLSNPAPTRSHGFQSHMDGTINITIDGVVNRFNVSSFTQ